MSLPAHDDVPNAVGATPPLPAAGETPAGGSLSIPSASETVARHIRALIFSGELGPGDRLSPGRDLAARLGISVGTLRIALKSLEATGYIVTSRGASGGSRVSDIDALLKCWTAWMRDNGDEVDDLFELRSTLETRIARLAAERREAADLEAIETANAAFAETHASVLRWNVAFHDAVARAAHSRSLARAVADLRGDLFLPVDLALREHRIAEIRDAHTAIVAAIRDRDADAAEASMRVHLTETLGMVRQSLKDARAGG